MYNVTSIAAGVVQNYVPQAVTAGVSSGLSTIQPALQALVNTETVTGVIGTSVLGLGAAASVAYVLYDLLSIGTAADKELQAFDEALLELPVAQHTKSARK